MRLSERVRDSPTPAFSSEAAQRETRLWPLLAALVRATGPVIEVQEQLNHAKPIPMFYVGSLTLTNTNSFSTREKVTSILEAKW